MPAILSFLQGAAGGAALGQVLKFAGGFVHAKWIRPAEVKAEIDLLTAHRNADADKASWDAFAASQKADGSLDSIPANVPGWAAAVYVLGAGLTKLIRPMLTLGGLAMVGWTFSTMNDPHAPYAQIEMAKEINFMAFTMWSWWFGERYIAKSRTPISLVPPAK